MMEPTGQQNRDDLLIESLRHTIEANTHAIEEYKKTSADMCIKIKQSVNNHHDTMSHFLTTLDQASASENNDEKRQQAFSKAKKKLDKMFFTVSEFYEKEYVKCRGSNSIEEHSSQEQNAVEGDETDDDKDQITLCVQDTLDKLIEQAEAKLILERQKNQHQQQ